jgi:hypothetical protein
MSAVSLILGENNLMSYAGAILQLFRPFILPFNLALVYAEQILVTDSLIC